MTENLLTMILCHELCYPHPVVVTVLTSHLAMTKRSIYGRIVITDRDMSTRNSLVCLTRLRDAIDPRGTFDL